MPRKTIRVEPMNVIQEGQSNEVKQSLERKNSVEMVNQMLANIIEEVKPKLRRRPKMKQEEEPHVIKIEPEPQVPYNVEQEPVKELVTGD
jgi:hypothetical protein